VIYDGGEVCWRNNAKCCLWAGGWGGGGGKAQNWLDNTYTNVISIIGLGEKLLRKKTI
jgi:hypothetical protein